MENKVSVATGYRLLQRIVIPKYSGSITRLQIDEFKGNADGIKYQLAVYDQDRKLIKVLEDRYNQTIIGFISILKKNHNIQEVVMDLFQPFRTAINFVLPRAKIIVDKYHYVRQVNWMLRDCRIDLFNKDGRKYRDFKKYRRLIDKHPDRLSHWEKSRIKYLKIASSTFRIAYEYKEFFYKLFSITDRKELNDKYELLITALISSRKEYFTKLATTLRNWKQEIIYSLHKRITNGFVEGNNNKIKVIKRIGYGYRKFSNLEKLIFLRV